MLMLDGASTTAFPAGPKEDTCSSAVNESVEAVLTVEIDSLANVNVVYESPNLQNQPTYEQKSRRLNATATM